MSKGQSALEYLVTYGWMLVAVSVAGAAIYQGGGNTCRLEATGATGSFPGISDIAWQANSSLAVEINNPQEDPVTLNKINFTQDGDLLESQPLNTQVIGESSTFVSLEKFDRSENCQSYTTHITYQAGSLGELESTSEIRGKIKLVQLIAEFTQDPAVAVPGEPVEFSASSTKANNPITSYQWEFSDGSTATGETVTHTFSSAGTYTAKLILTDDEGRTDTKTESVFVGGVILKEGGSLPRLGITNTLSVDCIGNQCTNSTSNGQTGVRTNNGIIKGTLLTDKIVKLDGKACITSDNSFDTGEGCPEVINGPEEKLSEDNYQMTGSLDAEAIKPIGNGVCIGDNC